MQRRHRVSLCLVPCVLVAASAAALAEDLAVPRDYRTVEDALVAAVAGDRVVLRGGTFENIQVRKGGVEILARGATVTGYLWIDASNVTVTGIRLGRNARMVVTGDDVTVTGTKATGRGRRAISVQGGRRATIVRNKMAGTDIEVLMGPDATIEQNRLKDGAIQATDDGAVIDSNVARTIQASGADGSLLDNRCGWLGADGDACDVANNRVSNQIDVVGDSALVTGNDVGGMVWVAGDDAWVSENSLSTGGISVTGDGATVVTNTVLASPLGVGIRGDDFTVSGNDLTAVALPGHDGPAAGFPMCPGIAIVGTESGGTITGNTITHRTGVGISVHANEVVVSGNDVQGVASNSSIMIAGAGNTIADNTLSQTGTGQGVGDGIDVTGDGNTVTGNDIGLVSQDSILVLAGTGNVITDNAIVAAPGCGIVLTCRTTETVVSGCTVNACSLGLVNAGVSTSLTGTTAQGNDFADILDLSAGFTTFEDNTYTTFSRDRILAPAINGNLFD